jgi:hypothetical protein
MITTHPLSTDPAAVPAAAAPPLADIEDGPVHGGPGVARMFRSSCTECGSTKLEWMTPAELAERVPAESTARVHEAVKVVGEAGEAWLCPHCGNFGITS